MKDSLSPKKSLGQHFLNSDLVPNWMCEAGEVVAGDLVVEIGPGTGVLTETLLRREAKVLAIETDNRALEILQTKFNTEIDTGQLTLIKGDVRHLRLDQLDLADHEFKIIANIPYYLSGHLLRVCIEHPVQPSDLVFLVQKEVAVRAAAKLPPAPRAKGSLLALSLQAYADVSIYKAISRGHFTPPPAVDSAILAIRNVNRSYFEDLDESLFFTTIRAGFASKRKQLQHNLRRKFGQTVAEQIFSDTNLDHKIRAEDLSLAEWKKIVKTISQCCQ